MVPNTESVDLKSNVLVWLCYINKKMTIIMKIKGVTRHRGQPTVGTSKAHPTGEFVIVAKFGGHGLRHLASKLLSVVRQLGRKTKILNFLKFSIWPLVAINNYALNATFGFGNTKTIPQVFFS